MAHGRGTRQVRRQTILYIAVLVLGMVALPSTGQAHPGDNGAPEIPQRIIEVPSTALAAPGLADSIALLSPNIPSHARAAPPGSACDKDIDTTSTIDGMIHIAAVDTGICDNADIDIYVGSDGNNYVVIAGRGEVAWTHINVTNPAAPFIVAQYVWTRAARRTSSPDIKTFRQVTDDGTKDYVALSTEIGGNNSTCGLFIFDVTNPANAIQLSRTSESGVWCSVHNSYIETDDNGNGTLVYITANSSADLRVYDIANSPANPSNPGKVGTYQRQVRGFFGSVFDDIYVHDVTVENGTVYASYWLDGLDMLSSSLLRGGEVVNETETNLGGVTNIDPVDFPSDNPFLTHHAFPNEAGTLVSLQDEIEINSGSAPVQLWTTGGNPVDPVDSLVQGTDVPVLPAHNLDVNYAIDGSQLYVGWYKGGLQSWTLDETGFDRAAPPTPPRTASIYHQAQTEVADRDYGGAWGVRTAVIGDETYSFVSDRSFGLLIGCSTCTATFGTINGTVTDSSNGGPPIEGATVSADTGQNGLTDADGFYELTDVPSGIRTVTASAAGYATQQQPTTVTDGGTSVVDFTLDPEPLPSGFGTVKGTVRDAGTGARLGGALVVTDTGEQGITNNGGKYNIKDVPEGNRTLTVSLVDYFPKDKPATVTAGQTTTVDFDLVPG